MAISKEQAMAGNYFHAEPCFKTVGLRGGVKIQIEVWRRNGATKTWVTKPGEFEVPIKNGLRRYGRLTQANLDQFHLESECPHRG